MAMAEDLDVFFDGDEFAVEALIDNVAVNVIYTNASVTAEIGLGIQGRNLSVLVKTSALPADPTGLTVRINATDYTVREYEHDGTGISTLFLRK